MKTSKHYKRHPGVIEPLKSREERFEEEVLDMIRCGYTRERAIEIVEEMKNPPRPTMREWEKIINEGAERKGLTGMQERQRDAYLGLEE